MTERVYIAPRQNCIYLRTFDGARMKKFAISCEVLYPLALMCMSLSSAFLVKANLGLPLAIPYIVFRASGIFTLGQCEYIVQGVLLTAMCLLLRRLRVAYIGSLLTGFLCGVLLDLYQKYIPMFDIAPLAMAAMPMELRIVFYVIGFFFMCSGVALIYRSYFPPNVYDSFVKYVSERFHVNRDKFKICYDITVFVLSLVMSFSIFGRLMGISVGTVVSAFLSGLTMMELGRLFDRFFVVYSHCPRLAHFLNPDYKPMPFPEPAATPAVR